MDGRIEQQHAPTFVSPLLAPSYPRSLPLNYHEQYQKQLPQACHPLLNYPWSLLAPYESVYDTRYCSSGSVYARPKHAKGPVAMQPHPSFGPPFLQYGNTIGTTQPPSERSKCLGLCESWHLLLSYSGVRAAVCSALSHFTATDGRQRTAL